MLPVAEFFGNESVTLVQSSTLLRGAYQAKASDIHFEPLEKEVRVRYRIDGILQEIVRLPKRVTRACVARIKIIVMQGKELVGILTPLDLIARGGG